MSRAQILRPENRPDRGGLLQAPANLTRPGPVLRGPRIPAEDYWRVTHVDLAQPFPGFIIEDAGAHGGPASARSWIVRELLTFGLPAGRWPQALALRLAGWATFPIKYLDLILRHSPRATRISAAPYLVGRKPEA